MPKLGMNMTKGVIVRWLVAEGTAVRAGEPLFDVETDKSVQSVESPASGVLARIVRQEKQEVPCLTVLAVITDPGEALPTDIPDTIADGVPPKAEVQVTEPGEEDRTGREAEERTRIRISPAARKLARELNVDITTIASADARITKEDIEAAYAARQAQIQKTAETVSEVTPVQRAARTVPEVAQAQPLEGVRRVVAERMSASARSVARVGLTLEADATELVAWRQRLNREGQQVGYTELLAKIVAHALHEFPYMNSQLVGNGIHQLADINVGVATDTERGLLVPVIRNADKKGVLQIHHDLAELLDRARKGRSMVEDLSGGTFTISNLGMFEIEEFLPIVNLPECAILGVGSIIEKPVAVGGQVEIRPRMALTLSFDHRLVDGAPAARFLQRVKHLINNPLGLLG